MLRETKNKEEILNFIGDDYNKAIYIYMDIEKYSLDNPNLKAWIQYNEENEIVSVIMRYFRGMHIYSKDISFNVNEIVELVKKQDVFNLCGETKTIKPIYDELVKANSEKYELLVGHVRELTKEIEIESKHEAKKATEEDIDKITKLIITDPEIGEGYTYEDLYAQLKTRMEDGFSRNYITVCDQDICSHCTTGGEASKFATIALLVTADKYRRQGYAIAVAKQICNDLIKENKKVLLINYSNESTALYDKLGFEIACDWAKIMIK